MATMLSNRASPEPAQVAVWDPLIRIFHWSLVALFSFAFATGDEWDSAHELAGYLIAGLVTGRIVWGFVGPRYARFADFMYRPARVLSYLQESVKLRAPRFLGHNPAGGAMVVTLLVAIAAIAGSGYLMTTDAYWGVSWLEQLHKVVAFGTLGLIGLHVTGVVLASIEHKENLVGAMFTGRKRAP